MNKSNPDQSASSIRLQAMQLQLAYNRLSQHPHLQAETIARHYVAHAEIAMNILRMRQCTPTKCLDECVEMLVKTIKTNHAWDKMNL